MTERNQQSGFTLIEITAVLFLIALIVALVGPNILNSLERGKAKAAGTQIAYLESILDDYYLNNKCYPTTEQGLQALSVKPTAPPVPETWDAPYAKKPIGKDPWSMDYVYKCPGERRSESYDLYSYGADKADGGSGLDADIWVGQ